MKKVFVTSTSGINQYPEKQQIGIIPITVFINGKAFQDGFDLDAKKLYQELMADKDLLPTTSQPAVGYLLDLYESLERDGYTEVVMIALSRHLSGTLNALTLAANSYEGNLKIHVVDSQSVLTSEAELAILVDQKFIKEDKPFNEVMSFIETFKQNQCVAFVCEDLNNLIKNGRLTGAKAFVGKLLKVKPLLALNNVGQILSVDKARTSQKALEALIKYAKSFINGRKFRIVYLYTNEDLLRRVIQVVKKELGWQGDLTILGSPVVGGHVGPYCGGIGIYIEE